MRSSDSRALLLAAFLAGCSGIHASAPSGATSKAAAASPAQPAPRLALGELTVTFDGKPIARLHADGTSESVGDLPPGSPMTPGPTLHADGTVTFTGADVTMHLEADGTLRLRSSDKELATITAGTLTFTTTPDDPIRLDGDILRLPGGAERNRVTGATNAALRVTTLVLTAAFYLDPSLRAAPTATDLQSITPAR